MKNLLIIFALIVALLPACVTQKSCNQKFPPQTKYIHSTNTVTVIRDTIIRVEIPGDTVFSETIVTLKDGLINSRKIENNTDYCYAYAQVVKGQLVTQLRQKEAEIEKLIKGAVKEVKVTEYIDRETVKEVNVLRWYQKWLMGIGLLALLLLGAWLAIKRIRPP